MKRTRGMKRRRVRMRRMCISKCGLKRAPGEMSCSASSGEVSIAGEIREI